MTLFDSSVRRTTRGAKNLTLLIRKRLLDLKLIWVRHELRVTDKREKKIEHRIKEEKDTARNLPARECHPCRTGGTILEGYASRLTTASPRRSRRRIGNGR